MINNRWSRATKKNIEGSSSSLRNGPPTYRAIKNDNIPTYTRDFDAHAKRMSCHIGEVCEEGEQKASERVYTALGAAASNLQLFN